MEMMMFYLCDNFISLLSFRPFLKLTKKWNMQSEPLESKGDLEAHI